MNLTAIRERITVDAIRWAPKGLYSAAIGWGARTTLPAAVRTLVYRAFARRIGARLDEVELPLQEYPNLGEFFARRLCTGARPLAAEPGAVVSPCDGTIAAVGVAERGRLIQAKGLDYSLAQLLKDERLAAALEGGPYVTIYLSPADYHRVHSPIASKLLGYNYVPGTLFPVNPLFSRSVDQLMARNERVVFQLDADSGIAALVMVAAVGVGNIAVAHDRRETRYLRPARREHQVRFDDAISIERGAELGAFHLGSTTILVFEPGSVELAPLRIGDKVRFGQAMGRACSPRGAHDGS